MYERNLVNIQNLVEFFKSINEKVTIVLYDCVSNSFDRFKFKICLRKDLQDIYLRAIKNEFEMYLSMVTYIEFERKLNWYNNIFKRYKFIKEED